MADFWFQTTYSYAKITQVSNRALVAYLLVLFVLSLVPFATKVLIEDTNRETLLVYGIVTLVVTVMMRTLVISLTKQSVTDKTEQTQRVRELSRQNLINIGIRFILLGVAYFFIKPALIIYMVLPILSFLQNIVDREEDNFVATLDQDQRQDYYQERDALWGNSAARYSQFLRNSWGKDNPHDPQAKMELAQQMQTNFQQAINHLQGQLNKVQDVHEKERLNSQIQHLVQAQKRFSKMETQSKQRLDQQNQRQSQAVKASDRIKDDN